MEHRKPPKKRPRATLIPRNSTSLADASEDIPRSSEYLTWKKNCMASTSKWRITIRKVNSLLALKRATQNFTNTKQDIPHYVAYYPHKALKGSFMFPCNKTILLYLANRMQSFHANSIFIMFDFRFIPIQISLCPVDAYVSWTPCCIVTQDHDKKVPRVSLPVSPWERGWNSHNAIDLRISFSWWPQMRSSEFLYSNIQFMKTY